LRSSTSCPQPSTRRIYVTWIYSNDIPRSTEAGVVGGKPEPDQQAGGPIPAARPEEKGAAAAGQGADFRADVAGH